MHMNEKQVSLNSFIEQVKQLLRQAQHNVVRSLNSIMVQTYFELGKRIVEEEQEGKKEAAYGEYLIQSLSRELTAEFGRGYSKRNLELIRKFYLTYRFAKSPISQSITWTHYLNLMRIENVEERTFYEIETEKNNWSVRELQRQIDSELYTRLTLSRDRKKVRELSEKGLIIEQAKDVIKDPYVLEFLGLPELSSFSENELEEQIISKLEHFLLELGNGFTFAGRQVRFNLMKNIFVLTWYFTTEF